MKTLSKIYSDKETRNGIAVNKTYLVPVEQIYLEPGYNIREADEQHVEYFAQCWESGQPLPALTVIPDEKGIRILDGQHRYLGALRAIERGAPIVRIECKDFTGDEADKIAFMVSSSQGKQLDPFERAKAYTRLKGFGWTNEEIAKKVGRSVSDVQMHLSLGDVPAEVKARISAGQISYANAVAVTREHGDDAVKVIDEAVEEAKAQGKDKVTAKVLKSKKIKPVDRLIELLKQADHVILPAGHELKEDEEFIQIPVADIHEVMASSGEDVMSKYEELDLKILHMLSVKPTPVFDIWLKFRDDVRDITVIDRRMQALKKKGFVYNVRGCGWVKL